MSLGHGASVVQDGLVLHLDAANPKSYSGSSTVWNDISGNGNSCNLVNSPSYTNDQSGEFVLTTGDDYMTVPNLPLSTTNKITLSFWCKLNSFGTPDGSLHGMLCEHTTNFNVKSTGFYIGIGDDSTGTFNNKYPISLNLRGNAGYNIHGYDHTSVSDLKWHYWTCVFDKSVSGTNPIESKFFVDGVEKPPTVFVSTSLRKDNTNNFGDEPFYIGGRAGINYDADLTIGIFKIYNRVLTDDEIKQNFEATRGRYGI